MVLTFHLLQKLIQDALSIKCPPEPILILIQPEEKIIWNIFSLKTIGHVLLLLPFSLLLLPLLPLSLPLLLFFSPPPFLSSSSSSSSPPLSLLNILLLYPPLFSFLLPINLMWILKPEFHRASRNHLGILKTWEFRTHTVQDMHKII